MDIFASVLHTKYLNKGASGEVFQLCSVPCSSGCMKERSADMCVCANVDKSEYFSGHTLSSFIFCMPTVHMKTAHFFDT